MRYLYLLSVVYLFYVINTKISQVKCSNEISNIVINKTRSLSNSEIYGEFRNLTANTTLELNIEIYNNQYSYIIFQVHSFIYNVTLSDKTDNINGTNIGLYSPVKLLPKYLITNNNKIDLKLYISIHGYTDIDPIPGGCNMELPVPISPFMVVENHYDYLVVEGSPAKLFKDKDCIGQMKYEFYRMYLHDRDYTEESYFTGLKNMLTLDMITEHGDLITSSGPLWNLRRMFSSYIGTGSIYVIVAHSNTGYSVYVPTHTYGCSLLDVKTCTLFDEWTSKTLLVILIIVGLFLCLFGYTLYGASKFLMKLGVKIHSLYLLLCLTTNLNRNSLHLISVFGGAVTSIILMLLCGCHCVPCLYVSLVTLQLGLLVACIVYEALPGGLPVLENNLNFWSIFIGIMLLVSLLLICHQYFALIISTAILGSYAMVFSIDHYAGANLKYIMVNFVRRFTVKNFNVANVTPPFGWYDALLSISWIGLAIIGILVQHYTNRHRPYVQQSESRRPLLGVSRSIYHTFSSIATGHVDAGYMPHSSF